eukprot:385664_1
MAVDPSMLSAMHPGLPQQILMGGRVPQGFIQMLPMGQPQLAQMVPPTATDVSPQPPMPQQMSTRKVSSGAQSQSPQLHPQFIPPAG